MTMKTIKKDGPDLLEKLDLDLKQQRLLEDFKREWRTLKAR